MGAQISDSVFTADAEQVSLKGKGRAGQSLWGMVRKGKVCHRYETPGLNQADGHPALDCGRATMLTHILAHTVMQTAYSHYINKHS